MMHARTIHDNLTMLQAPWLDRKFLSRFLMTPTTLYLFVALNYFFLPYQLV